MDAITQTAPMIKDCPKSHAGAEWSMKFLKRRGAVEGELSGGSRLPTGHCRLAIHNE
ncbi:hypothetical protein [Streptomyces sp. SID14515]|uniref:hypothetical protein n=1 Tax=Streptomyces sp. SID14515 TaxID=2706074 RepID=UPI0013C651C9|nr:hypothetical protein [Streptomyces sp. SID14515]NEB39417.1 hypothetical protein [Streptomyces sp. SID14515]